MWEEPLAERAAAAVSLIERAPSKRRIRIIADADVDGISSAAVLARALHRMGRRFHVTLSRRRDDAFFRDVVRSRPDLLITADLGAMEVQRFQRERLPTIICDHHTPGGPGDDTVVHLNPHLVGEDGSRTACGAEVSYVLAAALLESAGIAHEDLLPIALLGALGDRYHGGSGGGLHGRLLAEARRSDRHLRWTPGPALAARPLAEALARSLDPFIGRAAGKPEAARRLLDEIGLDAAAEPATLSAADRRVLASWLTLELLTQGAVPGMVTAAVSPGATFAAGPLEGTTLDEAAALMDATCRHGRPEEGLAALLGATDARAACQDMLEDYRGTVRDPVLQAARGRLVEIGPFRLLRIADGRFSGCVADRAMAWTAAGQRPLVVLGPTGPGVKASLRARPDADWRLDEAAAHAAPPLGGVGGGHRLAAGATVPADHEARFLEAIRAALETQQAAAVSP